MTEEPDSGKAPREWWIMQWESLAGADNAWRFEKNCDISMEDHKKWEHRSPAEKIHVIEKSAYDQLAQELALVKAAKAIPTTNSNWPHEKKLHEELAKAKAETTKMREACANYPKMVDNALAIIANRGQQIEIYEKTLKTLLERGVFMDAIEGTKFMQEALAAVIKLKGQHT